MMGSGSTACGCGLGALTLLVLPCCLVLGIEAARRYGEFELRHRARVDVSAFCLFVMALRIG